MLKNYFTIAVRSLLRQKGYSVINALGLSLGVTCFILILLFIQDELSYDRYHEKAGRIYRLTEVIAPAEHSSSQPFSVAPTLANDYPAMIEHAVRFFNMQAPTLTLDNGPELRFNEHRFFFVDSTVFEVFTFPFIKGDPKTALHAPYSLVITEAMAKKYFGSIDAMGKTLRFEGQHDLKVTGIIAPVPDNSHFKFDFLASFSTITGMQNGVKPEGWNWNPCWTYLLLTEGTSPEVLAAQLPGFVEKYFPDNIRDRVSLHLQALPDIHLHSHLDFEITPNSDIAYVYIFSAIAGFVLLIACINFMNLATARSAKRAREVGMRKVLGAERAQLIRQFLGESFVMSLLAVALALPLVDLTLPILNNFLDKAIVLDLLGNRALLLSLLGTIVLVGFVAGVYPAFVLSAFRPMQVLKGKLNLTGFDWTAVMRKGLVVTQFAISIILIIGTLFAYKQLRYLQQANLGFDKERVIMINMFRSNLASRYEELKSRLLQNSNVLRVTTSEEVLGSKYQTNPFKPQGSNEYQQFQRLMVGYDFVETFNLELVAGRSFSKAFSTDDSLAVMINEAMVRHLNWGSPQEALGKGFTGRRRTQVVIGVLKDFHFASLHNSIRPFVLDVADTESGHNFFDRYLAIRIAPENYQQTITHLQRAWSEFLPNRPFEYFFMDDEFDKLYRAEENLSRVTGTFAAFAIFVGCLGLFGLASFTAEQRTKEIGIRKVLGASMASVAALLSKDFVKLVLVANLVAWPVAWYAMNRWLQSFAYRIELGWWVFALAGGVALLIALLTVSTQAIKAALANPVEALRYE
ncbi:ABC transporter permease [candidate division KSB1 bacterium]|nr:ABC transporter permease [candidate division KSB1 bacterium]